QLARNGRDLLRFRHRLRVRLELAVAGIFSISGGHRYRRLVGAQPDVHCGDFAGAMAWPASSMFSVQRGLPNSARLLLPLPDWPRRAWGYRVALEARRLRAPRCILSGDALQHSTQSALAGYERPN